MALVLRMRSSSVKMVCRYQSSEVGSEEHLLGAVTGAENEPWSSSTPHGQLSFTIGNPGAFGHIQPGREYIVTIEEAPEEAT
jgi:hypothetical protein